MRGSLRGSTIFITGASGFVGGHLVRYLEQKGAQVIGFSSRKRSGKTVPLNILDRDEIESHMKAYKPQVCIHLAGISLVEHGQKNPYETFLHNVKGTLNILEASRKHRVKRIIIASSMHVYGDGQTPHEESFPPRPSRPYETSKTCADLIAQSYADSFHLPVLIPRFSNIYGPGDMNFSRLIPKTIKQIFHDGKITMWGGKSVREYLYIHDALTAYERLILQSNAAIEKNRIYNFCTGRPMSAKKVIDSIIQASKKNITVVRVSPGREQEIVKQIGSFKKAEKLLSWHPEISFQRGIKDTIQWYERYFSSPSIRYPKRRSAASI